jgi:copper homeostasis protein
VRVPVHVMLRPREGHFMYNEDELQTMLKDVGAARSAGVDGIVCGILQHDGTLDAHAMQSIIDAARPLRIVCHRAFDATPDATAALEALMQLRVDEVLTSGHAATAVAGMKQLAAHCRTANGRIGIMAGGGVRADNVLEIAAFTKVPAVHVRATDTTVFAAVVERLGRHAHG